MSVTKECRLCGRILEFNAGMRLQTCPACGSQNECPQMEGLTLDNFRQAIRLRNAREFDRAEKSYDLVLNADPDNAEALWGRVLCHYGAAPVFDGGKTYYMIHRPDDLTPLQEQVDYKYACQLAPPELRAQIEIEGRYIDRAIQRIRELADTKPAYDVFLCHKCSRPEGGYTEDYKRANNLYMMLREQGYRVFFAPVEMERRAAGEDYEAMIYHALRSSRVMLVVCSNREYLLSKWVQAEWQRYLRMMRDDPGKRLIPLLYGGLDVYRLPTEFRNWNLQCINMEGDGNALVLQNVQRIVGVRQNVRTDIDYADRQDEPPPPPPPRNHFGRMLTVLAVLAALVIGAAYFILNPPFCTHSSTSRRQVGVSYERYSDELHWVTEENALFCDFCGKKLQTQTGDAYLEAHVFSGGACTKCDAKTTPTPEACQHPWSDVDWNDWQYAYYNEDEHQKWRTGEERCGVCDAYLGPESEPVTREEHSYWGGKCRYCGVQVTPTPTACPHANYNVEWNDWEYSLYSDKLHTKWRSGDKYCTSCEAYLGPTSNSQTEEHSYWGGECRYCGVKQSVALYNKADFRVGATVKFGHYEQDGRTGNGKEPISWTVLDKSGDHVMLLACYALDAKAYKEGNTSVQVTWSASSLRTWLNNSFYYDAFSQDEQNAIRTTNVSTPRMPQYDTNPGPDTQDKVYLLSYQECQKYLNTWTVFPTQYAINRDVLVRDDVGGTTFWWLRSTNIYGKVSVMNSIGHLYGSTTNDDRGGVRPVIWVDISNPIFE